VALDTLGMNLGALFAAETIFAIGLGFAMQDMAQSFASGLILLLEHDQ
jgi:small-conductance mechanosensitive channel